MKDMDFEKLSKENPDAARDFIREISLLIIFLNYYPEVRSKWLEELELPKEGAEKIKGVADEYAKRKVEKLNEYDKLDKKEQVVKVENEVLRDMYKGIILKLERCEKGEDVYPKARKILEQEFPNSFILGPEKVDELNKMLIHGASRGYQEFIIFDPENDQIVGAEIAIENE